MTLMHDKTEAYIRLRQWRFQPVSMCRICTSMAMRLEAGLMLTMDWNIMDEMYGSSLMPPPRVLSIRAMGVVWIMILIDCPLRN